MEPADTIFSCQLTLEAALPIWTSFPLSLCTISTFPSPLVSPQYYYTQHLFTCLLSHLKGFCIVSLPTYNWIYLEVYKILFLFVWELLYLLFVYSAVEKSGVDANLSAAASVWWSSFWAARSSLLSQCLGLSAVMIAQTLSASTRESDGIFDGQETCKEFFVICWIFSLGRVEPFWVESKMGPMRILAFPHTLFTLGILAAWLSSPGCLVFVFQLKTSPASRTRGLDGFHHSSGWFPSVTSRMGFVNFA